MVADADEPMSPSFYASSADRTRTAWSDWWVLLHPPYTLWHLGYVAIGAAIAPRFDGGRLLATLIAFFLAVGVGAHALDELHDRPLQTSIPSWLLVTAAAASITAAVALGVVGVARVGSGLAVFIVVGVALNCGYNLELWGGRLHNDVTFAAAWGSFPLLTSYWAQAETLRIPGVVAAAAAYWISRAQRSLSTPARLLRRRVAAVDGTVTYRDRAPAPLTATVMLAPLESALKAMSWGVVALAVAMTLYRMIDG